MTTIFEEEVTCGVCGHKQTVTELGSTNTFGSMDLDTRPPDMQRSTMDMWVHECEGCGFVAPELLTVRPSDASVVATSGYRAALDDGQRSRLANRFVCCALLDEAAGELATAGWRRLHAAWVCDDHEADEAAQALRRAAVALFERGRAAGQRAMPSVAGGEELLLADLARRSRAFELAESHCAAGLALPEVSAFVTRLLVYERGLVMARDTGCHSVADVEAPGAKGTVH
jgi:hypothetical protein